MRLKQRAKHALNRASTVLVATLLFAGASGGTAAASELFSVLPDGKIVEKSERHFTYFPLITAVNKGKIDTNRVGGRLTRVAWELPPSYEPFHAVNNYKAQVEKLGGEVLFHCQGEQECGRAKSIIATLQPKDTISNSGPTVFTARITSEAKTLYISLYSAKFQKRTGLQFDILEVMPEPLDLVSVDKGYLDKPTAPMTFKDMSAKDLKGSKDHPMIQRLPGARINKYIHHGFGQGLVMTGITKGKHHVVPVDGKVTDIGYELPRQYSEYEVFANYQAALNKLGFTPRFRCQGSQCGNKDRLEKALNTLVHIGFEENQYYGLYHLERAEGNIHAMVYVIGFPGSLWAELRVIEESELNDERLVIDLEGLNDNIAQTGHVHWMACCLNMTATGCCPNRMTFSKHLLPISNNTKTGSFMWSATRMTKVLSPITKNSPRNVQRLLSVH